MEVCVDSIISAENACKGGGSRLELCSALSEGGLTPTQGLLKAVKRKVTISSERALKFVFLSLVKP